MRMRLKPYIVITCTLLLAACSQSTTPTPMATTATNTPSTEVGEVQTASPAVTAVNPLLATPIASSPAAGICANFDGLVIAVQILPGIPDPRCVQVRGDQQLSITNRTEGTIEVGLGPYHAELAPGQEYLITAPFEVYLAPGVHAVNVSPCCGGEIVYGIDLGE
jgi:hypothetical protein